MSLTDYSYEINDSNYIFKRKKTRSESDLNVLRERDTYFCIIRMDSLNVDQQQINCYDLGDFSVIVHIIHFLETMYCFFRIKFKLNN